MIYVTIGQSKGWRVPRIHAPGADPVQPWSQRPPLGADLRGGQISPQAGWDLHPGQDAGVWSDEVCTSVWGHQWGCQQRVLPGEGHGEDEEWMGSCKMMRCSLCASCIPFSLSLSLPTWLYLSILALLLYSLPSVSYTCIFNA